MNILGITGFEDFELSGVRHIYTSHSSTAEEIFSFSQEKVPLQFFPLHLIGHDSSAALLAAGKLAAFVAEERLSRMKHSFNLAGRTVLPRRAIGYCLQEAKLSLGDIDYVAHYCNFTRESIRRRFDAVSSNLNLSFRSVLQREYETAFINRLSKEVILRQLERYAGRPFPGEKLIQVKHHLAHAAGTFYSSGFDEAFILTIDGYGEDESSVWAVGTDHCIFPQGSIKLPTSLGLLYQIITLYLGFHSFGDEYKVMGLSSYGNPNPFMPAFDEYVKLLPDGTYVIEGLSQPDLFLRLRDAFGEIPSRGKFSQKAADIAAALQKTLERTLLHCLSFFRKKYGMKHLCISGGVGLNACANGAILRSGLFEKVFFQPAAADDGASLGAALYVLHQILHVPSRSPIPHAFWGPSYSSQEIEAVLRKNRDIRWRREEHIEDVAAGLLSFGKIVGWFQGRTEMGPRALGARSILSDPSSCELRDKLNVKVKHRELFRPFAPSVLAEEAGSYFSISENLSSPFMIVTFDTIEEKRKTILGVVHVDGSARIQTVSREDNPRYYRLLRSFYKRTGIPVILNTSFNRAGEPIVNSPKDALSCFLRCGLDALVIEDYLIMPNEKNL